MAEWCSVVIAQDTPFEGANKRCRGPDRWGDMSCVTSRTPRAHDQLLDSSRAPTASWILGRTQVDHWCAQNR